MSGAVPTSSGAGAGGLEDFTRPLLQAKNATLQSWAQAAQARLAGSLAQGQAVGGAPLAPNEPKYARSKGGRPPGVKTGAMLQGLLAPDRISWNAAEEPGTARVEPAVGKEVGKLNVFLRGHGQQEGWRSERTANGKRKAWKVMKGQPARDFVGVDERDAEAAGETAISEVARVWGFEER